MIELLFSTADTDLATGRARVMAAINARAATVGLAAFFPAEQAFPGRAPDVPCSALNHLLPAPLQAALAGDFVVINVADGLRTRTDDEETSTVTGYRMDVQVELRWHPELTSQLAGVLSGPWAAKADTVRTRSAEELAVDPGAPATFAYKEDAGVRLHMTAPHARQHRFMGS